MTAEDMFLELGYNWSHFKHSIYYKKVSRLTGQTIEIVTFDLKTKTCYCSCGMEIKIPDENVKKAIQKQKEELGWI